MIPSEPGWYQDPDDRYRHQAHWDGSEWTGATRDRSNGVAGIWLLFGMAAGAVASQAPSFNRAGLATVLIVDALVIGLALMGLGWSSRKTSRGRRAKVYLVATWLGLALGAAGGLASTGGSLLASLLAVVIAGSGVALGASAFWLGRLAGILYRSMTE